MNTSNYLVYSLLAVGLSACGGGGGTSSSTSPSDSTSSPLVGVLLDAPVAGIAYQTVSLGGITNGNGEFQYRNGEDVTFSVGSVTLPPVQAAPIVTPLDMAGSQDMANQVTSNILVFLQSLDQDGNPSNGISIASNAASSASKALNFNVPTAVFASNSQFMDLVANAGGQNTVPVSLGAAHAHFSTTLNGRNIAVAPLANAGTAQNVVTGTTVTLNGSGSTDANGDALTYAWTLTSKPAGSSATLSGANTVNPTFVADVAGSYVASLVARDGSLNSTPATVTVTAAVANVAPVANAGTAQNVVTGTTVTLNGSGSTDANGDALTYAWTLTSKPAGSSATLSGANTVNPTFVADVAGSYVASLVARDGSLNSTPATVTVTAGAWITPAQATSQFETNWGGTWYTGPASYAVDNNQITAWTYNGLGSIEFDLGSSKNIGGVSAAWQGSVSNGNTVNIYIDGIKVISEEKISTTGKTIIFSSLYLGRKIRYETLPIPHNVYLQIATWSEIGEFKALVFD